MAGRYRIQFNVDIVLVIDATGSMRGCIETIKDNANKLYDDIYARMREEGRAINQMRVRVIAFRDYLAYMQEKAAGKEPHAPMLVTDFFNMPEDTEKIRKTIESIHAVGGGDDPEDGLEALAFAIRSRWAPMEEGIKNRQIIVLWTDAATHEIGYGSSADNYPAGMVKDFKELSQWWEMYLNCDKRLLLFAPEAERWNTISNCWQNVIHYKTEPGQYDADMSQVQKTKEYQTIIDVLLHSLLPLCANG